MLGEALDNHQVSGTRKRVFPHLACGVLELTSLLFFLSRSCCTGVAVDWSLSSSLPSGSFKFIRSRFFPI
jgi:hypothetical protein